MRIEEIEGDDEPDEGEGEIIVDREPDQERREEERDNEDQHLSPFVEIGIRPGEEVFIKRGITLLTIFHFG